MRRTPWRVPFRGQRDGSVGVVLSVGRIAAGDGFRYLTSQVASHDTPRAGEPLLSYYERTGMPPGVWAGAQAAAFGLVGSPTETQMRNLFGRCADPTTGEPLGRRMGEYRTVAERVADRIGDLGRPATQRERANIEVEESRRGQPQAVTAFDLTFSAPKSVSVLWALGGDEVRDIIQAAHEGAWRDALAHFEADVAATRLGGAGVAQVDVDGVTVAAFEHWFNRSGDPQLHTHLAVSTMVRTAGSGRWRRLDSRAMYRAAASVGERYTGSLLARLSDTSGVGIRHRDGRGDRALPELVGVDDRLIEVFSTRAAQVDATLARLVGEYSDAHGFAPDRDTTARLAQQAVTTDRPASEQRSWSAERAQWLVTAANVLGVAPAEVGPSLLAAAVGVGGPLPTDTEPALVRAPVVVARLEERGATWNRRDIAREAAAVLREANVRVNDASITALVDAVVADAESVSLAAPDVGGPVPDSLRRADGSSVFERRGEELFTSTAILDAERDLASLAAVRELPAVERDRRFAAGWADLEDDDLMRRVAAADTHIANLRTGIAQAQAETPGLQSAAADATAAAENVRLEHPASAALRAELDAEDAAVSRLTEIETVLEVGGLRGPRRAEREWLTAEARDLRRAHPALNFDPIARAERASQRLSTAARLYDQEVSGAEAVAAAAALAASRHHTNLALLVAREAEHVEGRDALADEVAVRQRLAGRVSMVGYLNGLGVDQAAAMVRLADPSAPLAALVGPAGSGKTTALAALVRAHIDAGMAVHILAPTAMAAAGLGDAVGLPAHTVAKALSAWDRGQDLPGRGDLILVDEASMATTLDVRDIVRVATEHGALVRLVGDPHQARAVGAGGALDIVARAGNAAELTELHRFAAEWEANASLRLRSGDRSVFDVYDAHDRISSGGYAAMLEDTYRHYRQVTADDPGGAVMIVSDNHSVQALSERARADRVADGTVEPGGVRLRDGSVAGVGDLVVTRRNDRQLRTGRGDTAFVKNRDRWEITARHADGTLTVHKLGSGQTATLPADYVAEHVELSYALTGYGAQGITVPTALAVVQPGDERSFAYVAATRGTHTNMIRVVTETIDEEPAGHHPQRSARDVLGDLMANSPAVTAHHALDAATVRQHNAAELFNRHRHTTRTLAERVLTRVLAARGAADLLADPDAWRLIEATELATERGLDPAAILAGATDVHLAQVDSAAGLLFRARLDANSQPTQPLALVADLVRAAPPSAPPDVAAYLDGIAAGLSRRRNILAARCQEGSAPEWVAVHGTPPTDPGPRARWADAVAHVELWREAHQISDGELLGRPLPPGHRDNVARACATAAADVCAEMSPDPAAAAALRPPRHHREPPASKTSISHAGSIYLGPLNDTSALKHPVQGGPESPR